MKFIKTLKKKWRKFKKKRYCGFWIDYPGVGKITDEDCVKHALKHMHWWDVLLDRRMVSQATLMSQNILCKVVTPKGGDKFKYPIEYFEE